MKIWNYYVPTSYFHNQIKWDYYVHGFDEDVLLKLKLKAKNKYPVP